MSGRTTPSRPSEYPSLRHRRPGMYWVTIALATLMLLSLLLPSLALLLG